MRSSRPACSRPAGGSFGLSFGLAFAGAIMLASLSLVFTQKAESSDVLSPAEQEQVADQLQENAEVMTNTHLDQLLEGQPEDVQEEILDINTEAQPIALQIALLIPLGAALLGLLNGFRMTGYRIQSCQRPRRASSAADLRARRRFLAAVADEVLAAASATRVERAASRRNDPRGPS